MQLALKQDPDILENAADPGDEGAGAKPSAAIRAGGNTDNKLLTAITGRRCRCAPCRRAHRQVLDPECAEAGRPCLNVQLNVSNGGPFANRAAKLTSENAAMRKTVELVVRLD